MKIKPKDKPPSTHARLAPSSFKGYEACPSYISDGEETKASQRGTMLHGILEKKVGDEGAFHKLLAKENLEPSDEHQLWLILRYLQLPISRSKSAKAKILKEHRFNLLPLKVEGCDGGTGDLVILWRNLLHIDLFDYKMGWWEVDDAEVNIQLWLYVLGCFFENDWAQSVTAHVLQPARDEISTHTFTRADIPRLLLRPKTIADWVNLKAGKIFNPTVDVCLWCANKADCRALHAMALRAAYQAPITFPEDIDLDPDNLINDENAGDVYDFADLIAKWSREVKHRITQMAVDGDDVAGHRLVETEGKRIIVDPEGAYEVLRDGYQLSLSEFLAASDPSITKLLKTAGSKAAHGEMGKTQLAASDALMGAGVITKSSPSAYLVRIKEKKPIQDG